MIFQCKESVYPMEKDINIIFIWSYISGITNSYSAQLVLPESFAKLNLVEDYNHWLLTKVVGTHCNHDNTATRRFKTIFVYL